MPGIKNSRKPHGGASPDDTRRRIAVQTYRALVEVADGARAAYRPMERADATTTADGYSDRMLGAISAISAISGSSEHTLRYPLGDGNGYGIASDGLDCSSHDEPRQPHPVRSSIWEG